MYQEDKIADALRRIRESRALKTTKLSSYDPGEKGYIYSTKPQSIRKFVGYYNFQRIATPEYRPQDPIIDPYVTAGYVLPGYVENTG